MSMSAHSSSGLFLRSNRSVVFYGHSRSLRQLSYLQQPFSVRRARHICRRQLPFQCAQKNGEDKAGQLLDGWLLLVTAPSWYAICTLHKKHAISVLRSHTESAESLFQKELDRRGINSSSLDTECMLLLDTWSLHYWLTGNNR